MSMTSVNSMGLGDKTCEVLVRTNKQSADIAGGRHVGKEELDVGAGDPGIMFGYARDETNDAMPLTHSMATRLGNTLTDVRKSGHLWWLRPDGKTQVTISYVAAASAPDAVGDEGPRPARGGAGSSGDVLQHGASFDGSCPGQVMRGNSVTPQVPDRRSVQARGGEAALEQLPVDVRAAAPKPKVGLAGRPSPVVNTAFVFALCRCFSDMQFTQTHEWTRRQDGIVVVGISEVTCPRRAPSSA